MYKVLVIGNGSTGFSGKDYYINNRTGNFLQNLLTQETIEGVEYCELLGKDYDPDANLQNFPLFKNNIPFVGIPRTNPLFKVMFVIKTFLQKRKIDLFHIFFPSTLGSLFALLAIVFNKDYSLYLRGQIDINTRLNKIILKKAKVILTVSSGFNDAISPTNPNCKQIKPMISIAEKDILLNKNNQIKPTQFLFVGRIERDKGVNEIVELCNHLDELNYKYTFNLVGGGPLFEEMKNRQNENKISKNLNLIGLISNKNKLVEFYENANLFVFPSYHEGFPRVLYEAMSKQLPIVTTMVGGIPAVMKDKVNCVGIEAKSTTSLIEGVTTLIEDDTLRVKVGKNAMLTMKEFFSKNLDEHEVLVRKFLNNDK